MQRRRITLGRLEEIPFLSPCRSTDHTELEEEVVVFRVTAWVQAAVCQSLSFTTKFPFYETYCSSNTIPYALYTSGKVVAPLGARSIISSNTSRSRPLRTELESENAERVEFDNKPFWN